MQDRIAKGLIHPIRSIIIAVLSLLVFGAAAGMLPGEGEVEGSRLPDGYTSTPVQLTLDSLDSAQSLPAFIVVARDDQVPLTEEDIERATSAAAGWQADGAQLAGPPLVVADNQQAALSTWIVQESGSRQTVKDLREVALIDGLEVYVTGPAGISADLASIFEGANTRLLLVAAVVVALLLIITYRSPWLWLVPLTVVAVADRLAVTLGVAAGDALGIPIDGSTTGIVSVLVFGAGTNYALLLISRYRDELRSEENRFVAMHTAWKGSV